jgi:hypothetical protein
MHPEFGDVLIYDDGDELTAYIGKFTHGHFSNFDSKLEEEAREQEIIDDVLNFLDALSGPRRDPPG